jgi:hypothetical protein
MKVKCEWVTCRFNTGKLDTVKFENSDDFGYCTKEEISLKGLANEDTDSDLEDVLMCVDYKSKFS